MRHGETELRGRCRFMVRTPDEALATRSKKDPRDLRVLDPACGSGHFLLYAFDLLLTIYEEAHGDPECPKSDATGTVLAHDYPSLAALRSAVPGLILAHNLHGVDIDLRCTQIAQLALWMRAQRAYRDFGVDRSQRAPIRRANIVLAERMPGEREIRNEFLASLEGPYRELADRVFEKMELAGEAGALLKIEDEIRSVIRNIYGETGELFRQGDLDRWQQAERALIGMLRQYSEQAEGAGSIKRRLFTENAARGFAFIDLCRQTYDVVLMNPPFGRAIRRFFEYQRKAVPDCYVELFAQFLDRAIGWAPNGLVGAITSRSFLTISRLKHFRKRVVVPQLAWIADLGAGVMDSAFVESAAFILARNPNRQIWGADLRASNDREGELQRAVNSGEASSLVSVIPRDEVLELPEHKILYNVQPALRRLLASKNTLEPRVATVRQGMATFGNFRFLRLRWEVSSDHIGRDKWEPLAKGGAFSFYLSDIHLLVNWFGDGAELSAVNIAHNGQDAQVRQASDYWRRPGLTYSYRSQRGFSARMLPAGCIVAAKGPAILSQSDVSPTHLLGWVNSRLIRWLIELQANAHEYKAGIVKKLPWVEADGPQLGALLKSTRDCVALLTEVAEHVETTAIFRRLPRDGDPMEAWKAYCELVARADAERGGVMSAWDSYVDHLYGVDTSKLTVEPAESDGCEEATTGDADDEDDEEEGALASMSVSWPDYAQRIMSIALGWALRRWRPVDSRAYVRLSQGQDADGDGILVDDEGHAKDVAAAVTGALESMFASPKAVTLLCEALGAREPREWLRRSAFEEHVRRYSGSRRRAPVYWQLAVPSALYSVWLNYHQLEQDTLYKVGNDYVAPKLRYQEQRRRDLLQGVVGAGGDAQRRRESAQQERVVEELRVFLDDIKRVAPLWKPNLDDGVVINFAPLWRLVPQHKAWQRELRATWNALCNEECDWAHLAMHLWPERVVPKCAADRSLAIAHGLEEIFWAEEADGRWKARSKPTRPVDELVKERTSAAVKAALKNLLDAPAPAAGTKAAPKKAPSGRRKTKEAEG